MNDFTLPLKPNQHLYVFLLLSIEFTGLWKFGFLSDCNMESEKNFCIFFFMYQLKASLEKNIENVAKMNNMCLFNGTLFFTVPLELHVFGNSLMK